MGNFTRAWMKVVYVVVILALSASSLGVARTASAQTVVEPVKANMGPVSMPYGSAWNGQVPPPAPPVPDFSALAAAQTEPPQTPVQLRVSSDPAIYLAGKPIQLNWSIRGYERISGADLNLQIHLPKGLALQDSALAGAVTPDGLLTLPVAISSGMLTWKGDASLQLPAYIGLTLLVNGQVESEDSVVIDAPHFKADKSRGGRFDSIDGKTHVEVPSSAIDETLDFDVRDPSPNEMPSVSLTNNPVEIVAVGETSGRNVKRFKQPVTIRMNYQRSDLDTWAEEDLMIFYYDPETADWYPLPTSVDTKNKTITAKSDHLTVFDYKAATWQAESLPTVDAFKTADFTGAGTYALKLWTPPGIAGFKPDLTLSYNSQVIDEASAYTQASWVGMGWSMDTGSIVRNMHETDATTDDTFVLSLNGVSSTLLPVSVNGTVTTYNTADQSYLKVTYDNTAKIWKVYAQDGSVYTFDQPVKTDASNGCVTVAPTLTWQWALGSAKDKNDNTYTYTYTIEKKAGCQNEIAIYPATIVYPHNRYRVRFVQDAAARADYQTSWTTSTNRVFYGTKKLSEALIEQDAAGTGAWSPIRRYTFTYSSGTTNQVFPNFVWSKGGRTLTLIGIQEKSGDGTSLLLPAVQFTYGDSMHLTRVDNSQGGLVDLTYIRWTYFDDINKSPRSLYTIFGRDECVLNTLGTAWVKASGAGPVRCDPTNYLQIGDPYLNGGSSAVGHRPIPEHLVKPGGRYRFLVNLKGIDGYATSVKWGFIDTGVANSKVLVSRTGVTALTAFDESLEMPVTYNPSNTRLRMEVDWGFFQRIEFVLYPQEYQVTSRTVTDAATGQSTVFTYRYDNSSPNTAKVSDAVAAAGTNYSSLYTYPQREYRGSVMSQVVNSENLATVNWYYQGDALKGRAYRTLSMQQSFYDAMGSVDLTKWAKSSAGTHSAEAINGDHFDLALQSATTLTNWSVYYQRASASLPDGGTAIAHIRLGGTGSQGEVGLVGPSGQFFGVILQPQGSLTAAQLRYNTGGGTTDGATLIANFKRDTWYGLMLMADSANGFRVRLWDLGHPENAGEATLSGLPAGNWTFRERVNANGTNTAYFTLDAYSEGVVYAENESYYTALTQYDTTTGNGIPDIVNANLMTYKDLGVAWVKPTESITRNYDGHSAWYGTRTVYDFNPLEQNGLQYGNLTRATDYSWDGTNWVAYQATKTEFWPNDAARYLVNLPARQTALDCAVGCDFATMTGVVAETLMLYDANTAYSQPPSVGRLAKQRSLLKVEGGVNRYGETGYGYDSYGNPQSVTTYSGYGTASASPTTGSQTATTGYDPTYHTYATQATNALNQITTTGYDYALGLPVSVTDPNQAAVSAGYDLVGRMTSVRAPGDESGAPTLGIEYYPYAAGNPYHIVLTQRIDANPPTARQVRYYSGLGKLIQSQSTGMQLETGVKNVVVDTQYDGLGRAVRVTKPYAYSGALAFQPQTFTQPLTTTVYDTRGRVTSAMDANANSMGYAYDGLQVTATDPKQNSTTTTSDAWGRVVSVTPPSGPGLSYSYDTLNRLTYVRKGAGSAATETFLQYDQGGRKTGMVDPDMGSWSYAYDALGALTTQTDARGCATTLSYDALNRLAGKTYAGPGACGTTAPVSYYYDDQTFPFLGQSYGGAPNSKGRQIGMLDGSGATVLTYDARGNQLSETRKIYTDDTHTAAESFTTGWTYNSADLPITQTYPDGEVVNLGYNAQGSLSSMASASPQFTYVKTLTYDEAGRVVNLSLGDSAGQPIITRANAYEPWTTPVKGGKLAALSSVNIFNAALQQLGYSYDPNGNITQIANSVGSETLDYSYDALNRLGEVKINGTASEAFGYDAATGRMSGKGVDALNLLPFSYDVAHPHAVSGYNGNSYSYDANGNQTGRVLSSGTYNLTYDAENHLTAVDGSAFQPLVAPAMAQPLPQEPALPTPQTPAPTETAVNAAPSPMTPTLEPDATATEPAPTPTVMPEASPTPAETGVPETATPTVSEPPALPAASSEAFQPTAQLEITGEATPTLPSSDPTLTDTPTLEPTATPVPPTQAVPTATSTPLLAPTTEPALPPAAPVQGLPAQDASLTQTLVQITARYWYDGNGGMVKSVINGVITYYAGRHYHQEVNGTTVTIRKFYSAGSLQIAVRTITGSTDTLTWVLTDHLGSTSITANADGTFKSEMRYTAFGEVRLSSGTTDTKYQYTGQLSQMDEIGLYYFVARFYDPVTAHFVSADTVIPDPGSAKDFDRYAYSLNNPILFTDPSGHKACLEYCSGDNYQPYTPSSPSITDPINPWPSTRWDLDGNGEANSNREIKLQNYLQKKAEIEFQKYIKSPIAGPVQYGTFLGKCTTEVCEGWHPGVDSENIWATNTHPAVMVNTIGTAIYSTAYGTVARVGRSQWGNYVMVEHDVYGVKFYSIYAHLDSSIVQPGDIVDNSTIIGRMGNTTAPQRDSASVHLHFEIRKATNINLSNPDPFMYMTYWAKTIPEFKSKWVDISKLSPPQQPIN